MTNGKTGNGSADTLAQASPRFVPAIDVHEDAEKYVVKADMPGCDPKEIEVTLNQGVLTLCGKVRPRQGEAATPLAREYRVGDYYRTFNVTESVDADRIEAAYEEGVLTLTLPKAEAAKPRKIEVRTK
jgi:HSP20 family protein